MTVLSSDDRERLKRLASLGGKARAKKLTPEQRRQSSSKAGKALFAKLTPEQISTVQSKASRAYWTGMTSAERHESVRARVLARTPEVRRESARKASVRRWGQLAYAAHKNDADQVYGFVREYISAKGSGPTLGEVSRATHHQKDTIIRLLNILERIGYIQKPARCYAWTRSIRLASPHGAISISAPAGNTVVPQRLPPGPITCIDCANPVCEQSKCRCELHLRRVREASKQLQTRRRRAAVCVNCPQPVVQGKRRCALHLRLARVASSAYYERKRLAIGKDRPTWHPIAALRKTNKLRLPVLGSGSL